MNGVENLYTSPRCEHVILMEHPNASSGHEVTCTSPRVKGHMHALQGQRSRARPPGSEVRGAQGSDAEFYWNVLRCSEGLKENLFADAQGFNL